MAMKKLEVGSIHKLPEDLALFSADFVKEPTTYKEAINCEQKEGQINWKDAINRELK
jgi:hypothetical protein